MQRSQRGHEKTSRSQGGDYSTFPPVAGERFRPGIPTIKAGLFSIRWTTFHSMESRLSILKHGHFA